MGRLPKMKDRTTSSKSRAGRRAKSTSPGTEGALKGSIDEWQDISQADLSVLSARSGGGITKKSSKGQKRMSRAQRLRKEKGMAMADAVVGKLEKKVSESKKNAKVIKERAADWEDLNHGKKTSKKERRLAQLKQDTGLNNIYSTAPNGDVMDVETGLQKSNTQYATAVGEVTGDIAEVDMIT